MEELLGHLAPFLLVVFRLSGLFLFAPLLSSPLVPMRVRVLLVFSLAVVIYPTIPPESHRSISLDVFSMGWAVMGETLMGMVVGYIAFLPVVAVQLGAAIMGQQMGFGLASVYNPALDTETDTLGELLLYVAIGVFLAAGGLEVLFIALIHTFEHVPLGGVTASAAAPLGLVTGLLSSGFELALRVASPLLALVMVETIASAFISKSMPQLNILSIGFGLKITLGILAIVGGLASMQTAIGEHIHAAARLLLQWTSGPAGGGVPIHP